MEDTYNEKKQFAVLIDSENISSNYVSAIFDELENYGFASVRRIYGNWSKGSSWKERLMLEYSLTPIQQFSYTQGKNSTDMAMVIDAMDLLYQNKVDGFCLVTSDSDFTRLANRLREENKYVLGMGESKTPLALARACNRFVHLDLIDEESKEAEKGSATSGDDGSVTPIADIDRYVRSFINNSSRGRVDLGMLGQRLSERYNDFDCRNYGYSKLSVFMTEGLKSYDIVREGNHAFVVVDERTKSLKAEDIRKEVKDIVKRCGGTVGNLSVINDELKDKHAEFDIKSFGYSRISSFIKSIDGLVVEGNTVRTKR